MTSALWNIVPLPTKVSLALLLLAFPPEIKPLKTGCVSRPRDRNVRAFEMVVLKVASDFILDVDHTFISYCLVFSSVLNIQSHCLRWGGGIIGIK